MKGYIKIETGTRGDNEGLFVKGYIEGASSLDKCILMYSLKNALQMDDIEWKLYVIGEHEGLFEKISGVEDLTDERRLEV